MKKISVLTLAILILFSCETGVTADADGAETISGNLENGLRYLSVSGEEGDYRLYRGDYIVFDLPEGEVRTFSVPGLGIDETVPRGADDSVYIKIKESGDYAYTLGDRSGMLLVRELESSGYSELTAQEALDFIEAVDPLILDVRTPGEYEQVRIPGSVLIPVQVLEENLHLLEPYKEENILVYCQSGNRSTVASRILLDEGFTRLNNLRYGIGDWKNRGLPTE